MKLKGPVSTKTGVVLSDYDIRNYNQLQSIAKNKSYFVMPSNTDNAGCENSYSRLASIGLAKKSSYGYTIGPVSIDKVLDLETNPSEYSYR